jgi:hypothetical protein
MNHEVRGVGLDDLGGLRFADNMALVYVSSRAQEGSWQRRGICTMSAPSLALAIAEKYGAPV